MGKPQQISWMSYVQHGLTARVRKGIVHPCYKLLLLFTPAWQAIAHFKQEARKNSNFTKGYRLYAKYYILYKTIRRLKPRYVLECGGGITTGVILSALEKNGFGKLISMDGLVQFGNAVAVIVGKRPDLEMHISPAIKEVYEGIPGTRYEHIPDYPYDFVFVDGPSRDDVDLDAFFILGKNPTIPILVDCRRRTVHALKKKYPGRFNSLVNLGFINLP